MEDGVRFRKLKQNNLRENFLRSEKDWKKLKKVVDNICRNVYINKAV